jgi:hypothetical protein
MTRATDLEQHIRDSYKLISEYEEILSLSDEPAERARSKRAIGEQWGYIVEYLAEYSTLCQTVRADVPPDIAQISVSAALRSALRAQPGLAGSYNISTELSSAMDPESMPSSGGTEMHPETRLSVEAAMRPAASAARPSPAAGPDPDLKCCLMRGEVCAFVGAGLSIGAGLPGWYDLIAELAARIGYELPPAKWATGDALIDAAQAYVNRQGLHSLISHLKDRLDTTGVQPTAAHRALARLPISLVFTANFDDLLERAYRDAGKRVEVVVRDSSIPFMRSGPDTVNIVKLYGDLDQPDTIVLARQQYESYFLQRPQMVKLLEVELSRSDTLYLGWSGSDPYFKLVFGELLSRFGPMMRPGYAVMFNVTDDQQEELRRKQIRLVELPAGDRTASLANWLEGMAPSSVPAGPTGGKGEGGPAGAPADR